MLLGSTCIGSRRIITRLAADDDDDDVDWDGGGGGGGRPPGGAGARYFLTTAGSAQITDVVAYFDAHCTGRQSCRVGVRNLIDIHPCQRDFTSYLEASYRCIRGYYYYYYYYCPVRAPGFERIDQLRFLAGCRKRRLNQALSVLSLSLGFFLSVSVVLLTTATFCIVLFFVCYLCVLSLGCSC